jgi:hypothetical protein
MESSNLECFSRDGLGSWIYDGGADELIAVLEANDGQAWHNQRGSSPGMCTKTFVQAVEHEHCASA